MGEITKSRGGETGYAWVVVAISFYAVTMSMVVRFAFALLLVAFVQEFGWSRGRISGALSLHLLTYGLAAPFVGMAFDRYGRRWLLTLGGVLLGFAMASLALLQATWQLYLLYGLAAGLAASGLGLVPHLKIVSEWFVRRRGVALGTTLAGVGAGGLLAPGIQYLFDLVGWRRALLLLGAFILLTTCPATWWGQRDPPVRTEGARAGGVGWRPAAREPGFVWLGLAYACHGFLAHMVLAHEVAYLVDLGFDRLWATSLFGAIGLFTVVGNVLWGFFTDRWGAAGACAAGFAVSFAGMLFLLALPHAARTSLAAIQVVLFGLGFGGLTASLGALMADRFRGGHLGELYGIMVLVFCLGSLGGPLVAGVVYDLTRSYTAPFGLAAAAVVLGGFSTWAGARGAAPP